MTFKEFFEVLDEEVSINDIRNTVKHAARLNYQQQISDDIFRKVAELALAYEFIRQFEDKANNRDIANKLLSSL